MRSDVDDKREKGAPDLDQSLEQVPLSLSHILGGIDDLEALLLTGRLEQTGKTLNTIRKGHSGWRKGIRTSTPVSRSP